MGFFQPDLPMRCHPDDSWVACVELFPPPLAPFRDDPHRPASTLSGVCNIVQNGSWPMSRSDSSSTERFLPLRPDDPTPPLEVFDASSSVASTDLPREDSYNESCWSISSEATDASALVASNFVSPAELVQELSDVESVQ